MHSRRHVVAHRKTDRKTSNGVKPKTVERATEPRPQVEVIPKGKARREQASVSPPLEMRGYIGYSPMLRRPS